MRNDFRKILTPGPGGRGQASGKTLFFDGGMGTELAARLVEPGPAASLTAPDAVLAIHRAYRRAGADVLLTNTFGANRPAMARGKDAEKLPQCVAESCRLAREALGGGGYLAGDIGPTGDFLEPYGDMTPEAMREAFRELADALAAGGVDLFIVETMNDKNEMALAVEACRAAASDIPVAASMSFDPAPDGYRTNTGLSAADAARAMAAAGADIIGANCGSVAPLQMAEIVRAFRGVAGLPIVAQANAGLPELQDGQTIYRLGPEAFASGMAEVEKAGAGLLGGCCGTTPAHIKALRRMMERRRRA